MKWLVDEHCCPLRSIRISNGKVKGSSGSYTPILTSKGRSLLGIALGNRNIGIVRYLVVDKRMLLSGEKGLAVETLAQNLDLALRVLPEEVLGEQALDSIGRHSARSSLGYSDRAESMSDNAEIATLGVPIGLDEEARGLADSEVRTHAIFPYYATVLSRNHNTHFVPSHILQSLYYGMYSVLFALTTPSIVCLLLAGIRSAVSNAGITFRDARCVQWNALRCGSLNLSIVLYAKERGNKADDSFSSVYNRWHCVFSSIDLFFQPQNSCAECVWYLA